MIKHILTLIWNQKHNYIGIFIEQTFIFIILMFCFINVSEDVKQYLAPGTLTTDNTYSIGLGESVDESEGQVFQSITSFIQKMKEKDCVVSIANTIDILPYQNGGHFQQKDTLKIDNQNIISYIKYSNAAGYTVFKPDLKEGTWLRDEKQEDGTYSAVISVQLADKANWQSSLGKQIQYKGRTFTIVGVIAGFKYLPLDSPFPTLILPLKAYDITGGEITVRIKPGEEDTFLREAYIEFKKASPDNLSTPLIEKVDQWKMSHLVDTILSFSLQIIPSTFLLIFAFIGTFGIFWMYSKKRKREFALRLAIGSTRHRLSVFVLFEGIILTTAAIIPGLIIFCLAYEFAIINLIAVGITLAIMFLFSAFSAWYPAHLVSRINPAETLHYE